MAPPQCSHTVRANRRPGRPAAAPGPCVQDAHDPGSEGGAAAEIRDQAGSHERPARGSPPGGDRRSPAGAQPSRSDVRTGARAGPTGAVEQRAGATSTHGHAPDGEPVRPAREPGPSRTEPFSVRAASWASEHHHAGTVGRGGQAAARAPINGEFLRRPPGQALASGTTRDRKTPRRLSRWPAVGPDRQPEVTMRAGPVRR